MSTKKTEFILSAKDETKAAFDSVTRNLSGMANHAKGLTTSFGDLARVVGVGFSAAGLVSLVKNAIDAQDNLKDLSKSTAISIQDLAGLSSAAQKSGSDLESIASSINKLSVNMGKDAAKFAAIGVTAKDPIEAFKQLADVFTAIEDPQERAAFGAAALGKSWAGAAPLLSEGGKAIGEMVDKGKALSKITEESAAKADALNDQLVDLKSHANGVAVEFANILVPSLSDTARAMEDLASQGHPLLALLRGFAGLGKLPFDLAIPEIDLSSLGQIKDLEEKLTTLTQAREKAMVAIKNGGTALQPTVDNLDRQITIVQNQIDGLKKYGDKIDNKSVPPLIADRGSPNLRAKAPDVQAFIGNGDGTNRTAKARAEEVQALTASTKDYQAAMESLNSTIAKATSESRGYDDAQETLHKLMTGDEWGTYSEAMKWAAIEQASFASGALSAAEAQKTLNELLADTPTAKYDEAAVKLNLLANAYNSAKISAEQLQEASQSVVLSIQDKTKESADVMATFAEQAARNMQDAFADFLFDPFDGGVDEMLANFGEMLQKMVAQAVAADLASRILGKAGGGEGDGWLGAAMKWITSSFHTGGVVGSGEGSGDRSVSPIVFANAPRFHSGGIVGDEVPIIAKRGEGVFTKEQMKAMGGHTIIVNVSGGSAPDVRRSAAQGAREALSALNSAQRYS